MEKQPNIAFNFLPVVVGISTLTVVVSTVVDPFVSILSEVVVVGKVVPVNCNYEIVIVMCMLVIYLRRTTKL